MRARIRSSSSTETRLMPFLRQESSTALTTIPRTNAGIFFMRAAAGEESAAKARLLATMARHFEPWRRRHARLSCELRDSPYLISWKN